MKYDSCYGLGHYFVLGMYIELQYVFLNTYKTYLYRGNMAPAVGHLKTHWPTLLP